MKKFEQPSIVIKIGGSTLGSHDTSLQDLVALQKKGRTLVVVHGGGKTITQWLEKQGGASRFVGGLRVTDAATLEVVVAVLAGLVNKQLVATVNSSGGKALGLSGIDGCLIQGKIKNPELGYVGEITAINLQPLNSALKAGYIAVIAPLAFQPEDGAMLNINADTAAAEIAAALKAERLVFLTDVVGVCDGSGRLIPHLTAAQAKDLIASGVASGGMIPKIEACLKALFSVPVTRIIDGRTEHALLKEMEGKGIGTSIS